MKVLYDHQIYTLQKFGGISRYFTEIIKHLPKGTNWDIAIESSNNEYLKTISEFEKINPIVEPLDLFCYGLKFKGKARVFNLYNKLFHKKNISSYDVNKAVSIEKIKKGNFDVFHTTYYDDYFLDYLGNKPFVLTIHDMIHEIFPEMINDIELVKRKRILANYASHIIAVSEKTKEDIIKILNIHPSRISVIYHANSLSGIPIDVNILSKFILFVGDRKFYKNFSFFLQAIEPLFKENLLETLICTGKPFDFEEERLIASLDLQKNIIHKFVDDNSLLWLYQNAELLIFPSYYEGFGIPILEAFTNQCPVILSNSSCFQEIAKDAALYFDAKDPVQLRDCVHRILKFNNLKTELIQKGTARAKQFNWEKAAYETKLIYEKLI